MKGIVVSGQSLEWADVEEVHAGSGEVRIAVAATAINRADLSQRRGGYPPPPGASQIMGLECAGIVDEVGDSGSRFQPGDRVCALLAGGGYAEYVTVPEGQVLPIPQNIDFLEAAALPEVFATAYLNIFMEAKATQGETILLHAGASGVGTAAIQMCREFGNPCAVTAGSDSKIERCVALGADLGCNRKTGNFSDMCREWTNGRGVDVILDPVGAAYLDDNLRILSTDGRLVLIGLMSGSEVRVDLGQLLMKRIRIIGSTLRARSVEAKAEVMTALWDRVWPLIERGRIKPITETVLPIQDANHGHELLAANETVGKIVLSVS